MERINIYCNHSFIKLPSSNIKWQFFFFGGEILFQLLDGYLFECCSVLIFYLQSVYTVLLPSSGALKIVSY